MNEDRQLLGPTSMGFLKQSTAWRSPTGVVHDFYFTRWTLFCYAVRHPIWWLKHRHRVYRGLGEQAALAGWKPIDPQNPAPELCGYDPVSYDFATGKIVEITKEKK